MTEENHEELNPATNPTPLEQLKEHQRIQRENLEVAQKRPDDSPEVPGMGKPSDKRKHPHRQMYGSGTRES